MYNIFLYTPYSTLWSVSLFYFYETSTRNKKNFTFHALCFENFERAFKIWKRLFFGKNKKTVFHPGMRVKNMISD